MALDFLRREDMGGSKLPTLHGHVCVKTYYAKSGNLAEVVEGDNIVTNALKDIFDANYLGCLNYGSMLPIYQKFYGGIVCYGNAHTLDADNYFMPSENDNPVLAHAGDTAPSTAAIIAEDLKRGSPLSVSATSNSVTQVWEWGSEQGNCPVGVDINAISLCHVDVGNAGTGSNATAFRNLNPFQNIASASLGSVSTSLASPNGLFAQYDDHHGLWFHVGDGDYSYRNTLKTSGTAWITVILRRLPYAKVGLFETLSADTQYPITVKVETSITFYNQPSYYFDYTNKKLWLFTNILSGGRSADTDDINYSVIDLSDLDNVSEESHGTIHLDNPDLKFAPTCMEQTASSYNPSVARNSNIIKVDNDVYIPLTSGASWSGASYVQDYFNIIGYQRCNLSSADQETILFNGFSMSQLRPIMGNSGILVGSGYVCNGDKGYACQAPFGDAGWNASPGAISWATHAFNEPQRPSSYLVKIGGCSGSSNEARYIYANKFLNSTLYNLGTPVHKTTAKSMQISYTLTEV